MQIYKADELLVSVFNRLVSIVFTR